MPAPTSDAAPRPDDRWTPADRAEESGGRTPPRPSRGLGRARSHGTGLGFLDRSTADRAFWRGETFWQDEEVLSAERPRTADPVAALTGVVGPRLAALAGPFAAWSGDRARWTAAGTAGAALTAFAVLIVSGRVVTEGPVVVPLSAEHGVHLGDLGVLVVWAAAVAALVVAALRGASTAAATAPVTRPAAAPAHRPGPVVADVPAPVAAPVIPRPSRSAESLNAAARPAPTRSAPARPAAVPAAAAPLALATPAPASSGPAGSTSATPASAPSGPATSAAAPAPAPAPGARSWAARTALSQDRPLRRDEGTGGEDLPVEARTPAPLPVAVPVPVAGR